MSRYSLTRNHQTASINRFGQKSSTPLLLSSILAFSSALLLFVAPLQANGYPMTAQATYDATATLPVTVSFSAIPNGIPGPNATWLWDFGDGQTSTQASPTHTYLEGGIFNVTVHLDYGRFDLTNSGSTTVVIDNVRIESNFNDPVHTANQWPEVDFSQILVQNAPAGFGLSVTLSDGDGNQTASDTGVTMDQNQGGNGAQGPLSDEHYYRFDIDFANALWSTNAKINIFRLGGIHYAVEARRFASAIQIRIKGPNGSTSWATLNEDAGTVEITYLPASSWLTVSWIDESSDTGNASFDLIYGHLPSNQAATEALIGLSNPTGLETGLPDFGSFVYDNVGIYRYALP